MKIKITEESINLNLNLTIIIHQKQNKLPMDITADNSHNLPNAQTEVIVASA